MPIEEIGYKVFYKDPRTGDLRSFLALALPPEFSLTYPEGQWTKAPVGGIFVFGTLEEAVSFGDDLSFRAIYACRCRGPLPLPPYPRDTENPEAIRAVWLGWDKDNTDYSWPRGTKVYEEIKPLRRLF